MLTYKCLGTVNDSYMSSRNKPTSGRWTSDPSEPRCASKLSLSPKLSDFPHLRTHNRFSCLYNEDAQNDEDEAHAASACWGGVASPGLGGQLQTSPSETETLNHKTIGNKVNNPTNPVLKVGLVIVNLTRYNRLCKTKKKALVVMSDSHDRDLSCHLS